jgi:RNA polymerase sigma-70 factor, ECF subfamily
VCIDELRRRRRRPLTGLGHDRPSESTESSRGRAARCSRPAFGAPIVDLSDSTVQRVDVDAAVSLLPEEFRAAVVLRDLCDLPYEEIARVLDIPLGTVRSRIARGRAALAEALEDARNPTAVPHVETRLGTRESSHETGPPVTLR